MRGSPNMPGAWGLPLRSSNLTGLSAAIRVVSNRNAVRRKCPSNQRLRQDSERVWNESRPNRRLDDSRSTARAKPFGPLPDQVGRRDQPTQRRRQMIKAGRTPMGQRVKQESTRCPADSYSEAAAPFDVGSPQSWEELMHCLTRCLVVV